MSQPVKAPKPIHHQGWYPLQDSRQPSDGDWVIRWCLPKSQCSKFSMVDSLVHAECRRDASSNWSAPTRAKSA